MAAVLRPDTESHEHHYDVGGGTRYWIGASLTLAMIVGLVMLLS